MNQSDSFGLIDILVIFHKGYKEMKIEGIVGKLYNLYSQVGKYEKRKRNLNLNQIQSDSFG